MFELGNDYIEYLNSMNNANSSNKNALAESQVLNNYYNDIKIKRELGEVIFNQLFSSSEQIGVILTGHAGDGKTSILIQILDKLGYFSNVKKPLKESEIYNNKLFYVKDMSELNEDNQKYMLEKFLQYPKNNISSLLISNTGPLINTFRNILEEDSFESLEVDLLNRLDTNILEPIKVKINGQVCKFIAVNMANIDNTYLVKDIINNLLKEKLWAKCVDCRVSEKCPIAFNYKICSNNKERIINIVEKIYTWFKENESRLTIRQMLSHLSFALTGNLSCEEINNDIIYKKDALFDYAFPNLLFGYKGTKFVQESFNIKAIKELNKIALDENALPSDYKLFVHEDFSMFDAEIKNILEDKLKKNQYDLEVTNEESTKLRRAFRRFYIVSSNIDESEFDGLVENIFCEAFNMFYKLKNSKSITHRDKNRIKNIIFEGLYKIFLGVYPKDQEILYITVKKELDDIQNVQLVLGEVPKNDINVKNIATKCKFKENDEQYITKITFSRCSEEIDLTFQMLQYFMRIGNGEIFTTLNPSFTFGLNNLKAKLLKHYRYTQNFDEDYSPEIKLIVIKKDGVENIKMIIEDSVMEVL
ncbi:hypothetical protein QOZ83_01150 [Romboutsia sedimentorum]|uniref:hypothetical protein n=1 Tax=Romboutsia sedimentorum TaxID=1368474 RepID=UPI0024DE2789|nr:hypothetical protein [Romboutsia sedimentorum]MDK2584452.1 hypothetical protein [Romboutsia sedimentorum]